MHDDWSSLGVFRYVSVSCAINTVTQHKPYGMPLGEKIITRVGNSQFLSKINLILAC